MSGIGALAGYGSDSDDDEQQVQAGPSTVPAAATAPASAAKAPPQGGLFAALPPPSADKKRKHQIKLDSLADLRNQDGDDDDHGGRKSKQSKSSAAQSAPSASSSSAHSLFGMLPAPTRKGPPTPPPREAPDEARMTIVETDDGGREGNSGSGAAAKKGNADFRAMLGLKPVEKKATAAAPASGEGLAVPGAIAKVASGSPSASTSSSNGKASTSKQPAVPPLATATTAPTKAPKPAPQPVDFFGLAQPTPPAAPVASSSRTPQPASSISSISSAPTLSTSHDPYPGWAQNPDGSWIPVTPEAHEAFALAQREQQHQAAQAEAEAQAGGLDERQRLQLVAAGYSDVDKLQSVDAAQAAALKRGGRPVDVGGAGADAQSAASRLDAKYAAAAAASKERAEGEDAYDEDDDRGASSSSRGGGRDKLTTHRARGKGQLSSLFAQADEKRGDLEEKWARARENKRGAASRYGW